MLFDRNMGTIYLSESVVGKIYERRKEILAVLRNQATNNLAMSLDETFYLSVVLNQQSVHLYRIIDAEYEIFSMSPECFENFLNYYPSLSNVVFNSHQMEENILRSIDKLVELCDINFDVQTARNLIVDQYLYDVFGCIETELLGGFFRQIYEMKLRNKQPYF